MASDYRGRTDLDRAIRNNNGGDIDYNAAFQGCVGSDGRFCIFENMAYGNRAFFKLMHTYREQDGCDTLRKIVMRYAPPNENNTTVYMNNIAKGIGIDLDGELPNDSATWVKIAKYFFENEASREADKYITDEDYSEGLALFNQSCPGYFTS